MSLLLYLPFPPSINSANGFGKNKRTGRMQYFPSKNKEAFFKEADGLFLTQKRGLERVSGPFTYHITLNEQMRSATADGDNRGKYCLDYLQRVGLIDDDKLAAGGSWSWGPCEHGAMISVYPVNRVPEASQGALETA
jgi:hypothetical protein